MQNPVKKEVIYPEGSLVFVWNADEGILNSIKDSLHKWISPHTYSCKLCELTHGFFNEKKAWRTFLDSHGAPAFFFYRDTFESSGIPGFLTMGFPLVLERRQGQWHILMDSEALQEITNLSGLILTLEQRTKNKG